MNYKLNHKRDPIDSRDFLFTSRLKLEEIKPIDLRPLCPPIRNQLSLGSCTAFAATALVDFVRRKQKLPIWEPSPLFTYFVTRKMEGKNPAEDSGAFCRTALSSTVKFGVAEERVWWYDISKFSVEPSEEAYIRAEKHQTLQYQSIPQSREALLSCLSEGYPFIFGMYLYESSYEAQFTGRIRLPNKTTDNRTTEKMIGGHCVVAVGFIEPADGSGTQIILRNSWGSNWGSAGYATVPLDYLLSYDAFDFWTIRLVEESDTDVPDPIPEPPAPVPIPTPEPPTPPVVFDEPEKTPWYKSKILYILGPIIFLIIGYFLKR